MSVGNTIYDLRKKAGMSQETLAEYLSVSRQTISKWESGVSAPDLKNIVALSSLFHISTDSLLIGDSRNTEDPVPQSLETLGYQCNSELKQSACRQPKNRKKMLTAGLVGLAVILVAGCVFLFVSVISDKENNNNDNEQKTLNISELANSVLYVDILDEDGASIGSASGFIIDDGKTLVTNYHVIEDAYSILAYKADSNEYAEALDVAAYDVDRDLAILKLDSSLNVVPLILGDSDMVNQGDDVIAIGYPLGISNTVSDGLVGSIYTLDGVEIIQITAPISHGSSGGAVFNAQGEVIGISSGGYTDGQNINVAVAVNELKDLICIADGVEPIHLSSLYIDNHTYGCSAFNFSNMNFMAEDDSAYYFCECNDKTKSYGLYKLQKQSDDTELDNTKYQEIQKIGSGHCPNIYKGQLYYIDEETNDIICCNKDGTTPQPLGIFSDTRRSDGSFVDNVKSMLIAENKIVIDLYEKDDIVVSKSCIQVYDLTSKELLIEIMDDRGYTYFGQYLYIGQKENMILELNMKSLEVQKYVTTFSPLISSADSDGRIYYKAFGGYDNNVHRYTEEKGIFCLDPNNGSESIVYSPDNTQANASYYCTVHNDNLYVNISDMVAPFRDDTYVLDSSGVLAYYGSGASHDVSLQNSIDDLNHFYRRNGETYDICTGELIGTWVFN